MNDDHIITAVSDKLGRIAYARLSPGQDLVAGIKHVCQSHRFRAAIILCCIGSLERAVFSYGALSKDRAQRHRSEGQMKVEGPLSLLGCQGIICPAEDSPGELAVHLHGSVFTPEGTVMGQDFADQGSIVFNTADIALAETSLDIVRRHDTEVNSPITTLRQ